MERRRQAWGKGKGVPVISFFLFLTLGNGWVMIVLEEDFSIERANW